MANARLLRSFHVLSSFFLLLSPMALAIPDSEALLQLKKSFDSPSTLDSWQPGSKPCDKRSRWVGLICENDIVTGIHLGSMGLSGKIDVRALVQIPGLRTLSFNNNSFAGPIPELNHIPALKAIYISQNKFLGEIPPDYFAKMASLKRVWLSHNNFTGEIPPSLFQLPRLMELRLENNQFTGAIPSIKSPALASVDFSNNRLEGRIPESLHQINASSFAGNPGLCGEKLHRSCDEATAQQQQPSSSQQEVDRAPNTAAAAALMTVAAVIFSLMVAAIFLMRKRRGKEKFDVLENEISEDSVEVHVPSSRRKEMDSSGKSTGFSLRGSSRGSRGAGAEAGLVVVNEEKGIFGMPDLMKAAAEALGNGSLGSSYKAVMSNGVAVAVKRMKEMNVMDRDGFDVEMRRLGRLQHRNVLTPLAYHHRLDEKLLVHEYIPKGSLLYLLHGNASSHGILQFSYCFL